MVLRRLGTTSRLVVAVLGALMAGSCSDWYSDCYAYDCVRVYYPYYGSYLDCYPVRVSCWGDYDECEGRDCHGTRKRACKLDDDCQPGQYCDGQGHCSNARGGASADAGTDGGINYTPGPSMDASAGLDAAGSTSDATSGNGPSSGGSTTGAGSGGSTGSGGSSGEADAATGGSSGTDTSGGRIRRFNFPCQRNTQCGPGECTEGECFSGCTRDEECGTADRCSVETGRRLCMPDPNPVVKCQDSADCRSDQTCVNGSCHDPCDVDTDCANPEDRCLHQLCFPDRRPMVECVLNVECASGLVCLDGQCVNLDSR